MREHVRTAVEALRDELKATTSKLHERVARLPLIKAWDPDTVCYAGDVVTYDGSVYQARKDTGKEPGHRDWILLARAGRDGCDGRTRMSAAHMMRMKTTSGLTLSRSTALPSSPAATIRGSVLATVGKR